MKYGLAVMAFIVVTFLAIIFFVNRSSGPTPNTKPPKNSSLTAYKDKNATLSITIQGKLVGEQQRRAVRISVSPSERRLEILQGYGQYVERSESYANTQEAYKAFIEAVNTLGMTKSKKTGVTEPLSICPFGLHYYYDVKEGGDPVSNLWSVSCNGPNGNFAGNGPSIRELFRLQVPNYNQQTAGLNLD